MASAFSLVAQYNSGFLPAIAFTAGSAASGSLQFSIIAVSGALPAISFTDVSYLALLPEEYSMDIASTLSFCPILSISELTTSETLRLISSSLKSSLIFTARAVGLKNFLSCLNITASPPILTAFSPVPRLNVLIGGVEASPRIFFDSSDISGQAEISTPLCDNFIAKARHVGNPHFLQFVLGRSLNISTPDNAIFTSVKNCY